MGEAFFKRNSGPFLVVAHLKHVVAVEGSFHVNQFINQDSETPNVDLLILLLLIGHFGRQILPGPTHRLANNVFSIWGAKPEVADFGILVLRQENVLGLDVSMNVLSLVDVLKSLEDFPSEPEDFVFGEKFAFEIAEKSASFDELQDDVQVVLVDEVSVELHYSRVLQLRLDLNFPLDCLLLILRNLQ